MAGTALDKVMQQAESAAESFTPTPSTALVSQPAAQLPSSRPSMESLVDSSGIQVDEYLTVKEGGFRLGTMKGYFKNARATLDLSQVVPIFQVRANRAGATTFIKSYDGIMTPQGQNFQQATQALAATHDKVDGPYQTAEIPATLLEDVTDGTVVVKAGTIIGITPAITGVKFFTKFVKDARSAGLQESNVEVNLVHTPQHNAKGNDWGVVAFDLVGPASE